MFQRQVFGHFSTNIEIYFKKEIHNDVALVGNARLQVIHRMPGTELSSAKKTHKLFQNRKFLLPATRTVHSSSRIALLKANIRSYIISFLTYQNHRRFQTSSQFEATTHMQRPFLTHNSSSLPSYYHSNTLADKYVQFTRRERKGHDLNITV